MLDKDLIKIVFLPFLLVFISACGFHLRGSYALPGWFNNLYVENIERVDPRLAKSLLNELRVKNITLAPDSQKSKVVLSFKQDKLQKSVYSRDPTTGITTSYNINYSMAYEVYPAGGKAITGSFYETQSYEFNSGNLLGAKEQEIRITNELIDHAVNSIFSHLSRHK